MNREGFSVSLGGLVKNAMGYTRRITAIGLLTVFSAHSAGAVDHYLVEAPKTLMAGDAGITVTITPRSDQGTDLSPHKIKFLNLPTGISMNPLDTAQGLALRGSAVFKMAVGAATPAGPFLLRVQKIGDAKAQGSAFLFVEKTVDKFALTPAGDTFPRVDQPVRFQVVALDAAGAVVTSFRDPVDLKADFGEIREAYIPGESFQKGVATVDVRFTGGDPLTGFNRLTVESRFLYEGQRERASGSIDLSLQPARGGP